MSKLILLTILLLFLSVPSANAEMIPCQDYAPYMAHSATVYLPDNPHLPYDSGITDITVKGRMAYGLGRYLGESVLQVFDLADDLAPVARGQLSLTGYGPIASFANIDHFVLVAAAGFMVVDVDDEDNPALVTVIPQASNVKDVLVRNRLAYLALESGELRVFDMDHPTVPVQVGSVASPDGAYCLAGTGDMLLVGGNSGLYVYSLADQTSPHLLGSVNIPGGVSHLSAEGLLAVVGDDEASVVDFSSPIAPVVVAAEFVDNVYGVTLHDGVAWIGRDIPSSGGSLERWSLADPSVPEKIGHDLCPGYPYAIVLARGNVYTANLGIYYDHCDIEGIHVWDGQDPRSPAPLGEMAFDSGVSGYDGSALWGDWLYVVGDLSVTSINLSDPYAPYMGGEVGLYTYPSFGSSCTLAASHLLVRLWNLHENEYWWQIYGLSDPAHPVLLQDPDLEGGISGHGDLLYNASGSGVNAYTVLPSGQLDLFGSFWPGEYVGAPAFAESGHRAAISHGSGALRLVDLTNPIDPVMLGEIPAYGDGGWRYLASWDGDLLVTSIYLHTQWPLTGQWELWDVADPSAPVLLHTEEATPHVSYQGLVRRGDSLYVADSAKIGVWDITVPTAPVHLGDLSHNSRQSRIRVHAHSDFLVTSGYLANVATFSYQCPTVSAVIDPVPLPVSSLFLDAAPNPFNPRTTIRYELPQAAQVTLTVYDLAGRRIRTLFVGAAKAGANVITWDGTDSAGLPSGSGVYFCRLVTGGEATSIKLLLLE